MARRLMSFFFVVSAAACSPAATEAVDPANDDMSDEVADDLGFAGGAPGLAGTGAGLNEGGAAGEDEAPSGGSGGQADAEPEPPSGGAGGIGGTAEVMPPPPAEGCDSDRFCDDFSELSGATWTNLEGVTLDDSKAHSAPSALKVASSTLVSTAHHLVSVEAKHFFVRAFLNVAGPVSKHTTIAQIVGSLGGSASEAQLEIGGHMGFELRQRHASIDVHGGLKAQNREAIKPGTWICLQWEYDSEAGRMQLWRDDQAAPIVTMQNLRLPPGTKLELGQRTYGAGAVTLWWDDLVVSRERASCQ